MINCKSYWLPFLVVSTGLLFVKASFGQTTVGSQPVLSPSQSAMLQMFQQEQQSLAQAEQVFVAQGATDQQIKVWYTQNAARFAAHQQLDKDLAVASAAASGNCSNSHRI